MKILPSDIQESIKKIQELAVLREDYIRQKGQSLSLKHSCHKLRIYPTSVNIFAPELYESWNDINFHFSLEMILLDEHQIAMPPQIGYKRKFPNIGTTRRIRELAAYREQHIKETGQAPIWTAACYRMGINLRTVYIHAPELAVKWYDLDFRW